MIFDITSPFVLLSSFLLRQESNTVCLVILSEGNDFLAARNTPLAPPFAKGGVILSRAKDLLMSFAFYISNTS
jgi:hypothetical protein